MLKKMWDEVPGLQKAWILSSGLIMLFAPRHPLGSVLMLAFMTTFMLALMFYNLIKLKLRAATFLLILSLIPFFITLYLSYTLHMMLRAPLTPGMYPLG